MLAVDVDVNAPNSCVEELAVEWEDDDTSDVMLGDAERIGPGDASLMSVAEVEYEPDAKSGRRDNAE